MSTNTMWGGRFESGPAAIMREITPSIDFDKLFLGFHPKGKRQWPSCPLRRINQKFCTRIRALKPLRIFGAEIRCARRARKYPYLPVPCALTIKHGRAAALSTKIAIMRLRLGRPKIGRAIRFDKTSLKREKLGETSKTGDCGGQPTDIHFVNLLRPVRNLRTAKAIYRRHGP